MVAYDLAASLKEFRAEVNQVWPGRDKASDGWIGDTSHKARPSDHNPDGSRPTPLVRAFDVDKDGPKSLQIGEVIAEHLRASKDSRIKYVIWNGRMFASYARAGRKAWQWGPYSGVNAHRAHVHLSVQAGSDGAAGGPWGLLALSRKPENPLTPAPRPAPAQEDDDMPLTPADAKLVADHIFDRTFLGKGTPLGDGTFWQWFRDIASSARLAASAAEEVKALREEVSDLTAKVEALQALPGREG